MKLAGAVVAVMVVAAVAGFAQVPPRDQSKSIFAPGSAVITGTVVGDDEKRAPLRNALVTLVRSGTEDMRTTATDEQGAYEFSAVPAGAYRLVAGKGAYVSMDYGAPKPGMPGLSVVLTDGQRLAAKPIALIRGAVIGGRLLDANGTPVRNTLVQASQFLIIDGVRQARFTAGAQRDAYTNGHGEYRIFGLLPGNYIVLARAPSTSPPRVMTLDLNRWAANPAGPSPPISRPTGYAPTMFPGTSDPEAAVPISLTRGEERLSVDLFLQVVPVARLSGIVTGGDGRPASNATVWRVPKVLNAFAPGSLMSARTDADGRFAFTDVAPGPYTLFARSGSGTPIEIGVAARPGLPAPAPSYGRADVTVTGQDLAGVAMALQPGGSLFGRIVIQGTSPRSWTTSSLRMELSNASAVPVMGAAVQSVVSEDGSFRVDGVVPGSYRLRVVVPAMPDSTWAATSVIHAGRDLIDVPVEIAPGANLTDVMVTVSDVRTQLAGTLMDAAGKLVPQLYVFVFSTDRSHWSSGARRIRSVRAGESGTYEITSLPPGEYFLCALTELDTMVQFQPEYLEQLVAASIKITLADGEKKAQNLRIGR